MDIYTKKRRLYGLDLFSGIGGNTLGLRDYIKTVAYCEFDKHAQSVLLSRMQDGSIESAPIWDDVSTLTAEHFNMPVDIIVGGFPCQDISVAGKGEGIREENRSGLFYQIMRLTDELKPRYLFLENVPAIRTRGLDIVLQELTQRGYDCRWTMLSAAEVGAPHKRERWFLLGSTAQCATGRGRPSAWSTRNQRWETGYSGSEGLQSTDGKARSDHIKPIRATVADSSIKGFQGYRDGGELSTQNYQGASTTAERRSYTSDDVAGTYEVGLERTEHEQQWKCVNEQHCNCCCEGVYENRPTESRLGGVADGISSSMDICLPEYLTATYWKEEPKEVPRVTEEKEQRVERIKRLGNAVVPLQARTAFEYLLSLRGK